MQKPPSFLEIDYQPYMEKALCFAQAAYQIDEVPVGAILIDELGQILGGTTNLRERLNQVTEHAEIRLLNIMSRSLESWRLANCTLVVTLEPCLMCAGAIYQARIKRVVYGCLDPKAGAMGSLYKIHEDLRLNHQIEVVPKVMTSQCSTLLQDFFKNKRRLFKTRTDRHKTPW